MAGGQREAQGGEKGHAGVTGADTENKRMETGDKL